MNKGDNVIRKDFDDGIKRTVLEKIDSFVMTQTAAGIKQCFAAVGLEVSNG